MNALGTLLMLAILTLAGSVAAQQPPDPNLPSPLREVGFEQNIGDPVPLDALFVDSTGKTVALGDYFQEKPVVLALVYYECPMICSMVLNGLSSSLGVLTFEPGDDFELVVVSFNPNEKPLLAAAKRQNYIDNFSRPITGEGWHFLTGDEANIRRLTDAVGFRYVYDEETKQYAHATGLTVLTPSGQISRYLFGIEYAPKDLRFALVESAEEKLGTVVDQLLLFCYRYDPETGKYGATIMFFLRLGAILTTLGILTFIVVMRRRDRRMARLVEGTVH